MRLSMLLISPLIVLAFFFTASFGVSQLILPTYGAWTGIRPLENKLKLLRSFTKTGQVDALVLGSSIADFGFSAETYSRLMSDYLGKPYRVFNFSSGATEFSTMPALYKLSRTVTTPKELFVIVPAQTKRPNEISIHSPDYLLNTMPVGRELANNLLPISKYFWNLSLIDKASALRDMTIYGKYKNLKGEGMDVYEVLPNGDRISYGAIKDTPNLLSMRSVSEQSIAPQKHTNTITTDSLRHFLPQIDIDALQELLKLASEDAIPITVFAHAPAGTLFVKPSENILYRENRRNYLRAAAQALHAKLINPLESLSIPSYGVMEDVHLNHYGAIFYTYAAFNKISGSSLKVPTQTLADDSALDSVSLSDKTFNGWTAVLLLNEGEPHEKLKCRFINNFAVPTFPNSDLFLALRMPDGSDITAPATKVAANTYEAEMNLGTSTKTEMVLMRLLYNHAAGLTAIPSPLAECNW